MSDLPSRDKRGSHGQLLGYSHAEFAALANAWRSGRLVDREVIDQRIRDAMTLENDGWADAIVAALGEET